MELLSLQRISIFEWREMGRGFGRHRGAKKHRVESCLALDVNALRRKGALTPGTSGTLSWERDRGAVESADFRADTAELIVCYDGHDTEAPKVIEQRVALSFVPARFGGARPYFLCPGAECGRSKSKYAVSITAVTRATESTKASLASW
jgi:hypothetical protein